MLKKIFLILCLCFLFSCQRSNNWRCNSISCQKYNSSKLTYKNPKSFLEYEILNVDGDLQSFINILSTKIDAQEDTIEITLSNSENTYLTYGKIRKGGQKIYLTTQAQNIIIDTLQKNEAITIELEDIKETIDPQNFSKKFKSFLKSNATFNKIVKSLY